MSAPGKFELTAPQVLAVDQLLTAFLEIPGPMHSLLGRVSDPGQADAEAAITIASALVIGHAAATLLEDVRVWAEQLKHGS